VMVVNGLLSDAVYGSRGILLLFVPLGLVMQREPEAGSRRSEVGGRRSVVAVGGRLATGVALAALVLAGAIWWRPMLGAWYADLGALEQSRIELSAYDPNHFDNPTLIR